MPIDKQSKTTDSSIASAATFTSSNVADQAVFEPMLCAKALLRGQRFGSLATIDPHGTPFASLVNVATTIEGIPIILISSLAIHTRNIVSDSRVSLLLSQPSTASPGKDPTAEPRVSISAHAALSSEPNDRRRFLSRHPAAASYAGFSDFGFYRLMPKHYHLVAGFGRIHTLTPEQMLLDQEVASDLAEVEQEAIAHLEKDHQDTLTLYATVLAGGHSGNWRVTGIDPEGFDLANDNELVRIWFEKPLKSASQLRNALIALATKARLIKQNTV